MEDAQRWQVVETPILQPADDYLTKSIQGPFIDTGINVRRDAALRQGRIHLSIETVREMARVLGLFEETEGTDAGRELALREEYNRGLADGLKRSDSLGTDLAGVLRHLGDSAPDGSGAAAAPRAPRTSSARGRSTSGTARRAQRPAGSTAGAERAAGAARSVRRSDDVLGAGGSDDRFRI